MADTSQPIPKHHATAREHMAGIRAARAFYQELMAAHLLRTQTPISSEPIPDQPAEGKQ